MSALLEGMEPSAVRQEGKRLRRVGGGLRLKPILSLGDGRLVGYEAVKVVREGGRGRPNGLAPSPTSTGAGGGLALLQRALDVIKTLPAGTYLSLRLSPSTLASVDVPSEILRAGAGRLVIGISERERIEDYGAVLAAVAALRATGAGFALEDVQGGLVSVRHLIWFRPQLVQFDASLSRGVMRDETLRELVASYVALVKVRGAEAVATDVRKLAQREMLERLGVGYGQGAALGARSQDG